MHEGNFTSKLAVGLSEAARLTSLSRRALEYHLKAGHLRSVRVGRRRLVLIRDLLRFLQRDWPSVSGGSSGPKRG
jgi:excisionase family DNA binding protein